jgi:hypothetical protein
MTDQHDDVREQVRERYAAAALEVLGGSSTGNACGPGRYGAGLYGAGERAELPVEAVSASLGCGNPTAVAELKDGETVLDLGCSFAPPDWRTAPPSASTCCSRPAGWVRRARRTAWT